MERTGLVAQNQAAIFEGLKDSVHEFRANKGLFQIDAYTQPFPAE